MGGWAQLRALDFVQSDMRRHDGSRAELWRFEWQGSFLKSFAVAGVVTAVSLGIANLLFFLLFCHPLTAWRNPRTEFAFTPLGVHSSFYIALSLIAGAVAIHSKRASHPLVGIGALVIIVLSWMGSGIVWSGPGDQLAAITPLIVLRPVLLTGAFILNAILAGLYLRFLDRPAL
jgi:hypothetical protein